MKVAKIKCSSNCYSFINLEKIDCIDFQKGLLSIEEPAKVYFSNLNGGNQISISVKDDITLEEAIFSFREFLISGHSYFDFEAYQAEFKEIEVA